MKTSFADETKVVLALLLLLLGLEVGARLLETRLSADVSHIRSLPAVAARFRAAPEERLKVLILGNSLTRDGIDKALLQEALARITGRAVQIEAMHPDGSSIAEWYYGYRRYFDQTGAAPDWVLLGTGRAHLVDAARDTGRLAAFYASTADLPDLVRRQVAGVEEVAQMLGARASALFAHRQRVQPLVFYNAVPSYADAVQAINAQRRAMREQAASRLPESAADASSAEFLDALLRTFQASGTRAIVVALPLPEPYALPESVVRSTREAQVPLLDLGARLQLPRERFPDGYHLDAEGAREFTRQLMEALESVLAPSLQRN